MESNRLLHPRRFAIGEALARAYPLPRNDTEEREEMRLLRRDELRKALR